MIRVKQQLLKSSFGPKLLFSIYSWEVVRIASSIEVTGLKIIITVIIILSSSIITTIDKYFCKLTLWRFPKRVFLDVTKSDQSLPLWWSMAPRFVGQTRTAFNAVHPPIKWRQGSGTSGNSFSQKGLVAPISEESWALSCSKIIPILNLRMRKSIASSGRLCHDLPRSGVLTWQSLTVELLTEHKVVQLAFPENHWECF